MVVDDHAGFRAAVRSLLAVDGRMVVCDEASSVEDALARLAAATADDLPDLVLMDVNMGGVNGMVGAAAVVAQWPQVMVVVCSTAHRASLPPLPKHPNVMFVPKDELDPDALWHWVCRKPG